MKIDILNTKQDRKVNVACKCPHCGHKGVFLPVGINDCYTFETVGSSTIPGYFLGLKKCPNENCNGHLFFISDKNQNLLMTSPSATISFDRTNIPFKVVNAFEEAIKCHSNSCFIASAIMIRKTLEELCIDRDANGSNLFLKLQNLGGKILIPKELIDGMNELRLLGNDAAHIEAQTFGEIGKLEIEISIEFTQEILKAVYQYESLVKKLKSFKTQHEAVASK
ncbi:MAG: DUF4145 domain-containing protein [Bacteroidia bacterium]|nr:DUF4145 domain-containing protein [Bacteroidota bacterium]MBP9082350.1 DUF4145 domain-containing protein [Bacteroidia bacterium]